MNGYVLLEFKARSTFIIRDMHVISEKKNEQASSE